MEQLESVTQIFKSNIATLQADDNTPRSSIAVLVPYKHFSRRQMFVAVR